MNRPFSPQDWAAGPATALGGSDAPPQAEVVQSQLERILASAQFRGSLRLTRFLDFVVATTLAGKADRIKAYTIATEALGRGTDFDPQNDPIVRVEARRLREALARYYAKDGRDDPVLIDLPRGAYVPAFRSGAKGPAPQHGAGTDSVPASVTAQTPIEALDESLPLKRSLSENRALLRTQRGHLVEISGVIRAAQAALDQSHALLQSNGQIGGHSPTHEPQNAAANDVTNKPPGVSAYQDTRLPTPLAAPPPAKRQRQTLSIRHIQNLIAPLTGRIGANVRLFQIAFAAIAVLAMLVVVFDIGRPLLGGPNHRLWYERWPPSQAAVSQAEGGEGAPSIYVDPVTAAGLQIPGFLPPTMIRQRLIDALARYDDITVVIHEGASAANRTAAASEQRLPPSIYRLASTVRYDDKRAVLIVQLIDAATGAIVWSRQYEHPIEPGPGRQNDLIAPDVAPSLLDPFGVIQARERVKLAAADPMKHTYRCILDANGYLRSFNPAQYQPVRDCLLQASERTPPTVTVFADLAFVYLRNYRFGIAGPPGDPTMLDTAYAMAARAVDLKPNSAFAQYALASVLLAKGDIARAKIADVKSYALNPADNAIAFGHATMLVLTGEVDAGLALLNKSSAKSPNSWTGYHVLMALGCYLKGDLKTAAAESRQIANPFFPPGLFLDALIADKAGDRARAQQDIAMLYQFYPAWQKDIHASIAHYLPEPMAEHIAADFKLAVADTMQ